MYLRLRFLLSGFSYWISAFDVVLKTRDLLAEYTVNGHRPFPGTIRKVTSHSVGELQLGPAIRGRKIERHGAGSGHSLQRAEASVEAQHLARLKKNYLHVADAAVRQLL